MSVLSVYGLLFLSAFLSATLLPGSSEVALLGLLTSGQGTPISLIAIASLGNIMGAVLNWKMGQSVLRFKDRRWFPLKEATDTRAQVWFARYGVWSLLLSWVPVIGDPLTLVAGVLRVPFWQFLLLVSTGKTFRYFFIVLVWQFWDGR